jgi:hypothetical protein
MIQSFFVWLLGPELATVFLLVVMALFIFFFSLTLMNGYEILDWWNNRNARK